MHVHAEKIEKFCWSKTTDKCVSLSEKLSLTVNVRKNKSVQVRGIFRKCFESEMFPRESV